MTALSHQNETRFAQAPRLETARLVLRPLHIDDFPAYQAFLATDRARFMGGPLNTEKAWSFFTNDTAQWPLLGMGGLMIVHQGQTIGQVAVCHGPIFPEPELGWFLYEGFEGQGFATEAAAALLQWAFHTRGLDTVVSYIDPANTSSANVARRLGGQIDRDAATPGGEGTDVWRYRRVA